MFEAVDRLMLAGLGLASMTRERAEKLFDDYVRRGQVERDHRSGFVKELMDAAEKARKDLDQIVAERVNEAMGRLKLATREDLQRVEAKLDRLLGKEQ